MMGDRYKMVPNEVKDLVRGKYGALPGTISDEIRHIIIGDEEPITCRPADLIEPELAGYTEDLNSKGYKNITEEDVLTYAMFPEVAINFFEANRR
ncbi:MAG: oxaloacetate decarboxylase subunit alpha, partial [Veillonella sp.]